MLAALELRLALLACACLVTLGACSSSDPGRTNDITGPGNIGTGPAAPGSATGDPVACVDRALASAARGAQCPR